MSSPHAPLINNTFFLSLWRGCINPLVKKCPRRRGLPLDATEEEQGWQWPHSPRCIPNARRITLEELRQVMSETMDKALEEFNEDMRRGNQRLASLEQNARQPRLAIEADVTADKKTRERTEGANNAVQAKHGDRCSAKRVQAGSRPVRPVSANKLSLPLSVAGMTSWLTTALRRENLVSHSWRCALQQPLAAYFPPAKPLQRRGSPITSHVFGSARPRRRILRGHQLNTPRTTAGFGRTISFLLPSARGSLKRNRSKLCCSILAVLQVINAPACFWERGTCCFMGRFSLGHWMRLQHFLADG